MACLLYDDNYYLIKVYVLFMKRLKVFLILSLGFYMSVLQADVVVRMDFQQGSQQNNVDVRLFEQVAPLSVANFLRYANGTTINGGNYNGSFLHRSVPGFILQGGGFSFDPALNDGSFSYDSLSDSFPGGLQLVVQDDPVVNEFSLSNIRATLAMAKKAGDPDSATNQWFFNLIDNSANLDAQNGGFTVFGEVIGAGMAVIDDIASADALANVQVFDKSDIHSSFAALPLINYTDPESVIIDNLVRLNSVTQLFSISEKLDFGLLQTGDSAQSVVTIENTSTAAITISDIASTNTLATPFTIVANTCNNITLAVAASCDITINYSPQLAANDQDSFNIEFSSPSISFEYTMQGAATEALAPDISLDLSAIEFGVVDLYDAEIDLIGEYAVLIMSNDGNADLNVSSVTFDITSALNVEFIDNCTQVSPLAPGERCAIPIFFKPTSVGELSGTLTIISDDPDENPIILPITGLADIDSDGIAAAVEDSAPNGGDGNFDGFVDSIQNNVASFTAQNNNYITLVSLDGTELKSVNVMALNKLAPPPDNIDFALGVLDFELKLFAPGSTAEVGLIMPAGVVVQTYYMYGSTPDDINPHWYEFMYDKTSGTGAIIYGDVSFFSPTDGTRFSRSVIRLIFKDGSRGDADLTINGIILDAGGPVIANNSDSSSGSLGVYMLILLMFNLLIRGKRHMFTLLPR